MSWGPVVMGLDISTQRIDAACIPLAEEPRLGVNINIANHPVKGSPRNPAERCIQAGRAARECLHAMHARGLEITAIAIEEPWGASRKGDRALLPILGAITAQLDAYPLQWWSPGAWRKQIGVDGRTKEAGHSRILELVMGPDKRGFHAWSVHFTPDAKDAIGVALALRSFLNAHEEAA
jgi:hypothetical protein